MNPSAPVARVAPRPFSIPDALPDDEIHEIVDSGVEMWPRCYRAERTAGQGATRAQRAGVDQLTRPRPRRAACRRRQAPLRNPFLEPVVGVWLVVEGLDLLVARRAIERDRLGQVAVRLEAECADAILTREALQLREQPAAESQAARSGRDPHSLQLRGHAPVELERAAADRLSVECRDHEEPGRRSQLLRRRGDADGVVEAVVEASAELLVVFGKAMHGGRALRVDDL